MLYRFIFKILYELTNKILDMQVKDKYLNPIVVDINQK